MAPVEVRHTGTHSFTARNDRGAEVAIGRADEPGSFSPVELLLAAAAGCAALTVEDPVARRVPGEVTVRAVDVRPPGANRLDGVRLDVEVDMAGLDEAARADLVSLIARAVGIACTVTRTIESGAEVELTTR